MSISVVAATVAVLTSARVLGGYRGYCLKYLPHGNGAVKGCHKCAIFYPGNVDGCMDCGGTCFKKFCATHKDVHRCLEGQEFTGCHKQCMGKFDRGKTDFEDCYFDPPCNEKVDWKKIGEIKGGFFARLELMHKSGNTTALEDMLKKVHDIFAEAGVPQDRINYILTKWVEHSLPEGLEQGFAKHTNITLNGLGCDNSYGRDLNQKFIHRGYTLDGRPYYQGSTRPDRFIYFDSRCADDTREPRWLLGGRPNISRHQGLNPHDGEGCDNDFSIISSSMHLPGGFQETAWKWCGDHGNAFGETVSITYEIPKDGEEKQVQRKVKEDAKKVLERVAKAISINLRGDAKVEDARARSSSPSNITVAPEEKCRKYFARGPLAVRGCFRCLRGHPDHVDECMSCGFRCFHAHCRLDTEKGKCLTGSAMSWCHKECMGDLVLMA